MAISYEEALQTLQAMFGGDSGGNRQWTRQRLDVVLRHEKGHMENTCELILQHGDRDPQQLVDRLISDEPEPQVALDERLVRELVSSTEQKSTVSSSLAALSENNNMNSIAGATSNTRKSRGTPTTLPDFFLRLPGSSSPLPSLSISVTGTNFGGINEPQQQMMDDERLARLLHDELFGEELARNPDFTYLSRQQKAIVSRSDNNARVSSARLPGAPITAAPLQNPFDGVNVMQRISNIGDGARRRLQLFAINLEAKMKGTPNPSINNGASGVGIPEVRGAAVERRGLLDDDWQNDDDMIEFETRKSK